MIELAKIFKCELSEITYNQSIESEVEMKTDKKTMEIFSFKDCAVRVVMLDNNPWFVAKDVADILGYVDTATMTRRLDEDEKGMQNLQTLGGNQDVVIINESGLYNAIIGSKKPQAKAFKKWVTSEVLPAIRKTGFYSVIQDVNQNPQNTLEQNAILLIDRITIEILGHREVPESIMSYAKALMQLIPKKRQYLTEAVEVQEIKSLLPELSCNYYRTRKEIYGIYKHNVKYPLSQRNFWQTLRNLANVKERRQASGFEAMILR